MLQDKVTWWTDHEALLRQLRITNPRLARWAEELYWHEFDIRHIPGKGNPADGLSRGGGEKPSFEEAPLIFPEYRFKARTAHINGCPGPWECGSELCPCADIE
jgi:hypothetical protein